MIISPIPENINVLLVEDDEIDVEVIKRKFKRHDIKNPLYHAICGVDALEFLRGENQRTKLPHPYIIFIDINMPKMNGLDFLKEVRNDPGLKDSIAFFLTTSAQDAEVAAAYALNAAGYFLKENIDEVINVFSVYRQINKFS